MSFFIQDAIADVATTTATTQSQGGLSAMLMPAVFIAVFYFLLWRPQSKRAKEHNTMVDSLRKGDEVITSGGIVGKIKDVSEKFITLNVSEACDMKIQRNAISSVLPKGTIESL